MADCIFCKILNKELPCEIIYEDEKSLVFLDIGPVNIGHTLVIPKKHYESIFDIEDETLQHLIVVAKKVSNALLKFGADGVNVAINNNQAAGQVVFHFHIHLIPRFMNDGLPLWSGRNLYIKEDMKGTAEKIRAML